MYNQYKNQDSLYKFKKKCLDLAFFFRGRCWVGTWQATAPKTENLIFSTLKFIKFWFNFFKNYSFKNVIFIKIYKLIPLHNFFYLTSLCYFSLHLLHISSIMKVEHTGRFYHISILIDTYSSKLGRFNINVI